MLGVQDREESGKESRKQAGDREGRKKNKVLEMALDFGDQEVTGALGRAISVEGWRQEPEVRRGGASQSLLCSCVEDGNGEGKASPREAVILVFGRTEKT